MRFIVQGVVANNEGRESVAKLVIDTDANTARYQPRLG